MLNLATVTNRYRLPLISEIPDHVREARIYEKLDPRCAFTLIRIKEDNEYRTAFQTSYAQLEYWVMQFGLTNAPAMFQSYIDDCLQPYNDNVALCSLDDILIHLTNDKEH